MLRNITNDDTKYAMIIDSLTEDEGEKIQSLLRQPPTQNKYETLKRKLLSTFQINTHTRIRELLNLSPLGDQLPSQLLQKMRRLMAEDDYKVIFDEIFLSHLPESIRQELSKPGKMDDLDTAGQLADQLYSETDIKLRQTPQICAFGYQNRGNYNARRARGSQPYARGRNRQNYESRRPNPRHCVNHQRYGKNCYTCLGNCMFDKDNAIRAISFEGFHDNQINEIQGNDGGEL